MPTSVDWLRGFDKSGELLDPCSVVDRRKRHTGPLPDGSLDVWCPVEDVLWVVGRGGEASERVDLAALAARPEYVEFVAEHHRAAAAAKSAKAAVTGGNDGVADEHGTDENGTDGKKRIRGSQCSHGGSPGAVASTKRTTVPDGSPENQWSPEMPSRGLGDTVAKFTRAIGLDAAAESIARAVTGKPCGCKKRQAAMNAAVPYRSVVEEGPS